MNEDLIDILSSKGLVTYKLDNFNLVNSLKKLIFRELKNNYGIKIKNLDQLHEFINLNELNNIRLKLASKLNDKSYSSDLIYSSLRNLLKTILGPDIAIQKNVGLSIQIPKDESSLLHVHSDVFDSDCSPYEIVIWIPLVSCYQTKSMFFLPFTHFDSIKSYLEISEKLRQNLKNPKLIKNDIQYLEIEPPSIALFSHSIWHGNTINMSNETRFSLNVRVKNIFTPYRGKKLGDFFKIAEVSKLTNLASKIEVNINE
tara:strand:+ start:981 stop:1751 length:771 start_codon:yes stop_codon:yes gene_type:complete